MIFRADTGNNKKIAFMLLEIVKQLLSNFQPWKRKFAKQPER